MSPIVARPRALWRTAAIAAVALITTTGLAQGFTPSASAAPAAPAAPDLTVAWHPMTLTSDANSNGRPDPGDQVTVTADVTAGDADVKVIGLSNLALLFVWAPGTWVAAGTTETLSSTFTVNQLMLDGAGGSGPDLGNITVTYRLRGTLAFPTITVPAPAVLYTAPAPLNVASALDITENGGPVDGVVREGDNVGYHTTLTNTTGKIMRITSMPGYEDFPGSATLNPGESQTFTHNPVTVTYQNMVGGSIGFPDATIAWSAAYRLPAQTYTGSYVASYGSVPTEAIDMSFTSDVATAVHNSGGAAVALGDAVAGDHVDYTFQLTNTGNVVLNYVYLQRNWSGSGLTGYGSGVAALVQGASLPSGSLSTGGITSHGGSWPAYPLQQADIDRGYVDLPFLTGAAPSAAVWLNVPGTYQKTFTKRVFLKNFTTDADLTFTQGQLNDANGDGIGQAGETVSYGVRFANNADQSLVIDDAFDAKGSDIASPVGAAFDGATVAVGDVIAKHWTYTITADDVLRGAIDAGVVVDYHGDVDGASNSRTAWADTIPTGEYVAPASTLDTAATYDDTNLDGFPSIGETVHVTVTVTNTGSYPLTGLTVADAAGSDVTGLLPVFPTTLAASASASEGFDYILTAADFARGSLSYSTEMTATGLPTTASSTSVSLEEITFQAYATDLNTVKADGIQVCESNGAPTDTITLLSTILVTPGSTCTYSVLPYGYRVVAFSTPMLLGNHTFSVTVPAALKVGPHSLALYAPDGTLVGWKAVTAKDPIALAGPGTGGALASTGANGDQVVGLGGDALLLVLLGTAFMVADSRRRKHGAR
jgi:uncharacterized repeat protein (TIGR01451 family)